MGTLGIIGSGSFGTFLADKLAQHFDVKIFGRTNPGNATFTEAAKCNYVVLAVPLGSYQTVLNDLKEHVSPSTIIVDVCSVKEKPIELIKSVFPNQPILATHPLFGPQSAADSLAGHTLILCPDGSTDQELVDKAEQFFQSLELRVIRKSMAEHDEIMADVHALTFFVARGLAEYGVEARDITTPSYQKLVDLADLEKHHSQELFLTIQTGNRFAGKSRHKIRQILDKIDDDLNNG